MIQSQAMQNGRLQIMHVDSIFDGVVAQFVGLADRRACLDATTGAEKYQERTTPGRFRASPVSVAGHILLTNRDKGTVTVVKAGPKFEKVAENTLPDILAASPAISGPRVYLRGVKTLWCVGEVTR